MSRIRQKKFKAFIHQIEGKSVGVTGYQWDKQALRNVEVLSLPKVASSIVLPEVDLVHAFHWRTSPQGDRYWSKKYIGKEALTKEDKQFLKDLLRYHGYKPRLEDHSTSEPTSF